MIPGSKPFLKKILQNDYNSNISPKEPKKPNSLNAFLQFRKDMMKSHNFYRNLPMQEGLTEVDSEYYRQQALESKAKDMQDNIDFRLLDADIDIDKAKSTAASNIDDEDEVMDVLEQRMVEREGKVFDKHENTLINEFGIVDNGDIVR